VDPGANPSIDEETFDPDYFFCHVEPELLFAKKCGPGEGGDNGGCHYNASVVSGMVLVEHAPVDCGGGDHPVDRTQIGSGGPAQANLQAASLVMSRDYQTAPIYVRPTDSTQGIHPRQVFDPSDPVVDVIRTWAQK
jgi:hypothetical protein